MYRSVRMCGLRSGVALSVIGLILGAGLPPAQAQFVCRDDVTGNGQGATATGPRSTACGANATASGEDLSLIHISEPTRPY